ncbi:adenylosuccinate lyase [candidate division TA06 bacterium]|uniref:Adenylosuccinate lyase n=1 Tax=candidate division TA06 bacterium TaxID=2250710 RepID=A0A933IBE9_UNCT6|nr:adenylosuccinate lyase [candidate division TA06 bacterium]
MIERYTLPKMKTIWSEQNKFQKWLEVELLACQAQAQLGNIPDSDLKNIQAKARFQVERINQIEAEVHHDVIAFLTNLSEHIGPSSRYVHLGMTSSDVLDTAWAALMKEAGQVILEDLQKLAAALKGKALEHKNTIMMGRSHGIHAEPITLGLKFALWWQEALRNTDRMQRAVDSAACGKISGAVGTFAHIDPKVEEFVCRELGLTPEPVSTQIVQRDRHAEYLCTLAVIAASLEKIALEIRHLQRTEIREAEEPFAKGQKGSSAMPHKKNPIICERICGLARLVRGNAQVGLENVALWHERDISHSSAERVIIPDSAIALDYMLNKAVWLIEGLNVFPPRMLKNIEASGGLIFSQALLLALVDKGLTREQAYVAVQKNAMRVWEQGGSLKELALKDGEISRNISRTEMEEIFNINKFLRNVDYIYQRIGLR